MASSKAVAEVLVGAQGIGAAPKQSELVLLGCGRANLVVDASALRKLKEDKEAEEKLRALRGKEGGAGVGVPGPVARIALALKVSELLKGANKVRAPLVKYLELWINAPGSVPAVAAGPSPFGQISKTLDDCVGLTPTEAETLASARTLTSAYAVICSEASRQLLALAVGVSSLSSEALPADLRFLDQAALENHGNKHVVAAGMAMRGVLEGSPVLTSSKGKRIEAFSEAPFAHAVASQILQEVSKSVNVELSCPQGVFTAGKDSLRVSTSGIDTVLLPLSESLLRAAALGNARTRELSAAMAEAGAGAEVVDFVSELARDAEVRLEGARGESTSFAGGLLAGPGAGSRAGLCAAAVTDALHRSLLAEAFAAVCLVRIRQGPAKAAEAAPAEAEDSNSDGKKKKKKKEKKKKGGIGKGSEVVLAYLEAACAEGQGGDRLNALCPAAEGEGAAVGTAIDLPRALRGLSKATDWALGDLGKFLSALQRLIEANQPRRKPKIAKGARDMLPDQMKIREGVFSKVVSVFKKHGAVSIDTPVFELRETLMGKYGEDSKLIYDLADQGGEILSLRYDLTVPFSRFCALHGTGNIKRYHVGKVYRRDQPQMNRGRFREFFQCDFDIAGTYSSMVPDSEVIKVMVEILTDLEIGDFQIKINHRLLLDSIMAVCGVPEQRFRPICSAIDKLDKSPWEEVRREMVEDKGLVPEAADKIGEIVALAGEPKEMLQTLKSGTQGALLDLRGHPKAKTALEELTLLFDFLEAMGALDRLSLDISLARGLDYYTGVIYEAVLLGGNVGSIAAGGRYDHLVGSFAGKDIPAVGVSIGIERVYAIIEAKLKEEAQRTGVPIRSTDTQVLVCSIGNGLQKKRMEVANLLWSAGVASEFGFKPNPKMGDQINYALEGGIPYMVLFGEDEIANGTVKIKDMAERTEVTVGLSDLVAEIRKLIQK